MDEMELVDPELRDLDDGLREAAQPEPAALSRVRGHVRSGLADAGTGAAGGWRLPVWWRYPAAGAAALALVLAGALLVVALGARGGPQGFTATVVPPPADGQVSGGASSGASSGAASTAQLPLDSRAAGAPAPSGQSLVPAGTVPIVGGSCSASPTVQFQGRGLAATGIAPVRTAVSVGTLNVSVQQAGTDVAGAAAEVQSRIAAVRDALTKAGVPASAIQVSSFSAYGDVQRRQFTAYASVQATVSGTDALATATDAVLQVPGVSAYSSSSPVAGRPTQQEVQDAVSEAAGQARQMAAGTATAAGVHLGDVQSVVAQPPSVCYGSNGPERVVQVTVTYALK
jgi:uncharacterized protein YggE